MWLNFHFLIYINVQKMFKKEIEAEFEIIIGDQIEKLDDYI